MFGLKNSFIKKLIPFLWMMLSVPQTSRAMFFSQKPEIEKFFTDPKIRQALNLALKNDFKKTEQFLIENKIDINRPGHLLATPMHFVLIWCDVETIKVFIKYGANPFEMAYGRGSPLQNLLTSELDLKKKLLHVDALIQAKVDFSSIEALTDIDHFISTLDKKTAYAFAEILIQNRLNPEALDDEGQPPFQNSDDIQLTSLLLKNKFPLYIANGVGNPLALKAYLAATLPCQPSDQIFKDAIIAELKKQSIDLASLDALYGPIDSKIDSRKFYKKNYAARQPHSISLHLNSTANQYAPKNSNLQPYQITLWLRGEKSLQRSNENLKFMQALENSKLEVIVSNQSRRFLAPDLNYLKSLKEIRKDQAHLNIDFNLAKLFPEIVKIKEELNSIGSAKEKYAVVFLTDYETTALETKNQFFD